MKPLTCAATRRRLQAFYDRELDVAGQIAVGAHLDWCDHCAAQLSELRALGSALQLCSARRYAPSHADAAVFNAAVVNRLRAEDEASFVARVRGMFEDMHLVYAGLGATAATIVCVVIMLSLMRFATNERPDSLAAIMSVMATPLECEFNEVPDAWVCRERWVERFQRSNEAAEQDAVFALEAVVTRQGLLVTLATLHADGGRHAAAGQVKLVEGLLDVVSRARLDPVPLQRGRIGADTLWLVEHATVHASKQPALDVPLPPKKRAASLGERLGLIRA